ncbi:Membrane transport protein [Paraliobacillus sp. PM-2]|uniref:AEC family transporter n=1 Tax=Paraliobacillus sp. PM-2 TaxID=1462524 RepID=UPI00061C0F6C|nr:AEC family transporter [Paraliobacillus sp. PM-2]CQR46020.1 Membrane transport protein [Paraliobacillus sp. PM-2]
MGFLTVLLPIFTVFTIGYIGKKLWNIDVKPIATMAIYLLSPFLAFQTFYQNPINLDYFYMFVYLAMLCIICIFICYIIGFIKRWSKKQLSGFILASSFMNNGNYGAPLVLLVFGETGFHYAVILMVLQQLIMCTIGIYIAAQGSQTEQAHSPLKEVIKVPIVYGALAGIIVNGIGVSLPEGIATVVNMVADAAIPTVMIVLGMQLATISLKKIEFGNLSIALVLRLAIAPIIAFVITLFLPIDEMVKQIMILTAAMPTAANTTMYAVKFNARPMFVSSATLTSTLLSIITLPIVLALIL